MAQRIRLFDIDRDGETLEVHIEHVGEWALLVSVPNTTVRFELRRRTADGPFEGSLGGRSFIFPVPSRPSRRRAG